MKLIAEHNTEFEEIVIQLYNEFQLNIDQAKTIVEKYLGIRPDDFKTVWDYGDSGCISISHISFQNTTDIEIDTTVLKQNPESSTIYYEPNIRTTAGLKLQQELLEKVASKWLRGCLLEEFGIHTLIDGKLYFPWLPKKEKDKYYIEISNSAVKYIELNISSKYMIHFISDETD